jgi:hypothetical protein
MSSEELTCPHGASIRSRRLAAAAVTYEVGTLFVVAVG